MINVSSCQCPFYVQRIKELEAALEKFPLSKQQELELKILDLQTRLHEQSSHALEMSVESYIQGYEDAAQVLIQTSKTHNKDQMLKRLSEKIKERKNGL